MNIGKFLVSLVIPLIIWAGGLILQTHPPKQVNRFWGYRTSRSMQNQETWDFAQRALSGIWKRLGAGMTAVTLILTVVMSQAGNTAFSIYAAGAIVLQLILIIISARAVEKELKKRFDDKGKRRN